LGWQHAHKTIGVVASSRRVGCRAAGRGAGSNSHLDRRPRLDGRVEAGIPLRRALAARLFTGAYHSTINDVAVPQVLFAVGKGLLR
jgi:hypothetical protein